MRNVDGSNTPTSGAPSGLLTNLDALGVADKRSLHVWPGQTTASRDSGA